MTPRDLMRAIYGEDADLAAAPFELQRVRGVPVLKPGQQFPPLWAAGLVDAERVAAELGLNLDDPPEYPSDTIVSYELVPVTLEEARRRAQPKSGDVR